MCKTSKPNLRGKWKKDGDEIAISDRIDMKTDGNEYSLIINDAVPDDEGVYSFHVLNKRTSANLYVKGTLYLHRFTHINFLLSSTPPTLWLFFFSPQAIRV